jgi:hypothetical protein
MPFLRQKYKQKPKQWGPFSGAKSAFHQNLKNIGVPIPSMFCPLWENAGLFHDLENLGESGEFFEALEWKENGLHVSNSALQAWGFLPVAFSAADNTPWAIAITFKTRSTSTTKAILAGNDNSTDYGYIGRYPGSKFRLRLSGALDFATITDFSRETTIIVVCDGSSESTIKAYQDGIYKESKSTGVSSFDFNHIGINSATYCAEDDIIYQISAWNEELSASQVKSFSDNLWGLLAPVQQKTIFPPIESGLLPIILPVAWKVLAEKSVDTSWKLFDLKEQSTSWKIFKELNRGAAWKILKSSSGYASWKVMADTTMTAAWKILNSEQKATSYKIINRLEQDSSWAIINRLSQDVSWKILLQGILSQNISWKILSEKEQQAAWKLLTSTDQQSAWKIFNDLEQSIAWQILSSGEISQALAWKILKAKDQVTGWRIQTATDQETAWKIINAKAQAMAWDILKVTDQDLAYKIFAELEQDTSWSIDSSVLPPAVKAVIEFTAAKRNFIFNSAKRTFIFYQKEK